MTAERFPAGMLGRRPKRGLDEVRKAGGAGLLPIGVCGVVTALMVSWMWGGSRTVCAETIRSIG